MTIDPSKDVLFAGLGTSAVCYYRVMLPAMCLGADWVGYVGDPPNLLYPTGLVEKTTKPPDWTKYKIVVIQQPNSVKWTPFIEELQAAGIKVIFEVDDYLHGISKVQSHDFGHIFDKTFLDRAERMMRLCDGIICSTSFIGKRYRKYGPIFVCRNGIDTGRYELTRPKRETVNIGWAGATGHSEAILPWLAQVAGIMAVREKTTFVSIGQPYAKVIERYVAPERGLVVPFAAVEQYPSAMAMFDIGLAPAGRQGFFRGKSDLRWLEAGALGIPMIADPMVYPDIEEGVTGFHAESPQEMASKLIRLIDDPDLRARVGAQAREYVTEHRSARAMSREWLDVFEAVLQN